MSDLYKSPKSDYSQDLSEIKPKRNSNMSQTPRIRKMHTLEATLLSEKTQKFPGITNHAIKKFRTAFSTFSDTKQSHSSIFERKLSRMRETCRQLGHRRKCEQSARLLEIQRSLVSLKQTFHQQQELRLSVQTENKLLRSEIKHLSTKIDLQKSQCCKII